MSDHVIVIGLPALIALCLGALVLLTMICQGQGLTIRFKKLGFFLNWQKSDPTKSKAKRAS